MLVELCDFCEKHHGNIYIYGAGKYGRIIGTWLDENNYEWSGFVETQKNKEIVLDKLVYSLSECSNEQGCGFIVCVSDKYSRDLVTNLKKAGISDYIVLSQDQVQSADKMNAYHEEYPTSEFINVLLYHRVINLSSDPQLLAVDVANFEDHIKFLKDNYRVLRFEDDWDNVTEKSIVITFDDGYADNYLYALPILEKYQIPATIFVSTENIDTNNEMWWDELESLFLLNDHLPNKIDLLGEYLDLSSDDARYQSYYVAHKSLKEMDPESRLLELKRLRDMLVPVNYPRNEYRMITSNELRRLSESKYVSIGGHTVTHSCLAMESVEKQKWEIESSKCDIESIIGKQITVFSYPFGGDYDYTNDTVGIVGESGYTKAGIVKAGLVNKETESLRIPRNLIRNWDISVFEKEIRKIWTIYG
ncbi:Polysaccharide deacetylase [Lachnospiraceae bacterium XBB2008]|nr:Polysaccharide deacetylase [Lachnospiraceae bacterium XBB2008]